MAEVVWTESALNDIESVAEYIALDNTLAASKFVQSVFLKTDRLQDFPESDKVIQELSEFNYRELQVNPVRVLYKTIQNEVVILGVVRQERDLLKYVQDMTDEN